MTQPKNTFASHFSYDVIVVGAGHAGIESALASARLNKKTLLVCGSKEKIGQMPCNPSIGGSAKGIVVREIDALGGEMAKAADRTALQMKILNLSRGPSVWALRAQSDKVKYAEYMQKTVCLTHNLTVLEEVVATLWIENNVCLGVKLTNQQQIASQKVILTTGTYLASVVLQGSRLKEPKNSTISQQLSKLGLKLIRLRTETPPRILRDSIDFSCATEQPGMDLPYGFSYFPTYSFKVADQEMCWLIHTNKKIKKIVENNLSLSPIYSGTHIIGSEPRYCPSFEAKVVRFNHRDRHQVFLEPESLSLPTIYLGGFPTSLPKNVQLDMIHQLPGFEHAQVLRYGFAIEYDAVEPTQMQHTLASKLIKNLYTAGQINGTSGYEEAACQGLMAAINACLAIDQKAPLILKRNEAYIGVLIDDLVTRGTNEPYRLLTSRAEWRLTLRNDNAEIRLKKYGHAVGLISKEEYLLWKKDYQLIATMFATFKTEKVSSSETLHVINQELLQQKTNLIVKNTSLHHVIKRVELSHDFLCSHLPILKTLPRRIQETIIIHIRYESYIKNEEHQIKRMHKFEKWSIPANFNYQNVMNLSSEACEKLAKIQPINIAQASRISGVNHSDIQMLLFHLQKKQK